MNLIHQEVYHITLGIGEIVAQTDKMVTVQFLSKCSKFQYPDAFLKFLKATNTDIQSAIIQEFERIKNNIEIQKQGKNEIHHSDVEQCSVQDVNDCSKDTLIKREKVNNKQWLLPGKRNIFFVFQGATYNREKSGGYIWAPITNKNGKRVYHWDRLLDVQPGDIILHGCDGYIKAISTARGKCYECNQPEELCFEKMWDHEGRRIDCDYISIKDPVKTSLFRDDIIRLCNVKYSPFDKDGNGNLGYLYEINRELARIFIVGSMKKNAYLAEIDYIQELLMEKDEG
ncbi:hypothetical protein [Anaerotignum sp.]